MATVSKKARTPKPTVTDERSALIAAFDAERTKHEAEIDWLREDIARLRFERRERETADRERRVYTMFEEVTDESAWVLMETLSEWSHDDAAPITLRLMQPGGDIVYGLAIFDLVSALAEEGVVVNTHAFGMAPSMGSILLQCGQRRLMSPNSFMLIHEGRTRYNEDMLGYVERFSDREDDMKFAEMLEDRCDAILSARSTFDPATLRATYARRDWWISAQEAVALGFADEIRPTKAT